MRVRELQNTTPYRNREQVAGHKKEQNRLVLEHETRLCWKKKLRTRGKYYGAIE